MREYRINDSASSTPKKPLPWLSIALGIGVIATCVLAFMYLSYNLGKREESTSQPVVSKEDSLPLPPETTDYEFYDILNQEEPIRIHRDKEEQILESSQNLYYVIVKGYRSYDDIRAAARQMEEWGIQGNIGAEPYATGTDILFRLRIGPFESRSKMNAQRDILYDNDLANEGLTIRK